MRLKARILILYTVLNLWTNLGKAQQVTPVKVWMSNLAADAVGVNTHLNYTNTVYFEQYAKIIKPGLANLGVKHIRDHFGNVEVNARYADLAHNYGIKLLVINPDGGEDLLTTRNEIVRLNGLDPSKPVVDMIEPANERDNGWQQDWPKLCAYLHDYWKIYHDDEHTKSIPLLGPSFANTRNSAAELAKTCSGASATMDMGNLHAYSGLFPESPRAGGWGISFEDAIKNYRTICAAKSLIETESGFKLSGGGEGHPAVSELTAAKYAPRLVLSRLQKGVNRLYFYQLINDAEDFGLLNDDGSPRFAYSSLQNFIRLMADPGDPFEPKILKYDLEGDTSNVQHMMFQKRDGRYMLIIWLGVNGSEGGYHDNDYRDINPPERKLILKFTQKASLKLYRPSFNKMPLGNGTKAIASAKNVLSIPISVPDHILIAEVISSE